MKRQRGSFTAYPADAPVQPDDNLIQIFDKNKFNQFSKLFLANSDNILEIIDRESTALDALMAEDEECPERCFMEEAKQILNLRRNGVLHNYLRNKQSSKEIIENIQESNADIDVLGNDTKTFSKSSFSEAEGGPHVPKFFYFYQGG